MRVLVVDQDSAMLEAIVRSLRERYSIDAVSNKGDCLDLLRQNAFEVIVAGERLEDGSGLELLGQVARRWPSVLRIFCADRHRLQLLKGRLGPFELFQTLSYPIRPELLESVLMLADAAQEADADTSHIQHVVLGGEDEVEEPDPFPPPVPEPRAAPSEEPPFTAKSRGVVRQMPQQASRPVPDRTQRPANRSGQRTTSDGAAGRSAADGSGQRPTSGNSGQRSAADRSDRRSTPSASHGRSGLPAHRSSTETSGNRSSSRSSRGALAIEQEVPADPLPPDVPPQRQGRKRPPVQFPVLSTSSSSAPSRFVPPLPPETDTVDSLADAVEMARHARSNLDSSPEEAAAKRTAFLIGVGAAVGLAILVLGLKLFGTHDQPAPRAAVSVSHAPQYPPEVSDLIAQIETALQQDDFQDANADVEKLRQLAPAHPRLPFFESLLAKHGDVGRPLASGPARAGDLRQVGDASQDSIANRTAQTSRHGTTSAGVPQGALTDPSAGAPLGPHARIGAGGTANAAGSARSDIGPRANTGAGTHIEADIGSHADTVVGARTESGIGATSPAVAANSRLLASQPLGGSGGVSPKDALLPPETPVGMTRESARSDSQSASAQLAPAEMSNAAAASEVASAAGARGAPGTATAGLDTAGPAVASVGIPAATRRGTTSTGTNGTGATNATSAGTGVNSAGTSNTGTTDTATTSAGTTGTDTTSTTAGPNTAPARAVQHSSASSARRASFDEPPPVVREPKLIRQVNASYPSAAKHDATEGSVDLNVTISKDGAVTDVSVAQATPPGVFDQSALAAVRRYKYDPRFEDGLPVEAHITVHLDFKQGQDAR
jgi:TonB family protein